MVTAIVQFTLPASTTRAQAAELFKGTAPRYRDLPGLVRKYYLYSAEGPTGGGVYLWKSREAAEQAYGQAWREAIRARYGVEPLVTYFDSPVIVDNVIGEITTDA